MVLTEMLWVIKFWYTELTRTSHPVSLSVNPDSMAESGREVVALASPRRGS